MNIDTDTQYAFTRPIADHILRNYDGVLKIENEVGNKKLYDPRSYLKLAERNMSKRVVEACGFAVCRQNIMRLSRNEAMLITERSNSDMDILLIRHGESYHSSLENYNPEKCCPDPYYRQRKKQAEQHLKLVEKALTLYTAVTFSEQ